MIEILLIFKIYHHYPYVDSEKNRLNTDFSYINTVRHTPGEFTLIMIANFNLREIYGTDRTGMLML